MHHKPSAWLHILDNTEGLQENEPMSRLSFSKDSPFGVPGVDHSKEFPVVSIPLYVDECPADVESPITINGVEVVWIPFLDSEVEPDGTEDRPSD